LCSPSLLSRTDFDLAGICQAQIAESCHVECRQHQLPFGPRRSNCIPASLGITTGQQCTTSRLPLQQQNSATPTRFQIPASWIAQASAASGVQARPRSQRDRKDQIEKNVPKTVRVQRSNGGSNGMGKTFDFYFHGLTRTSGSSTPGSPSGRPRRLDEFASSHEPSTRLRTTAPIHLADMPEGGEHNGEMGCHNLWMLGDHHT
jgi:hypothetical protein